MKKVCIFVGSYYTCVSQCVYVFCVDLGTNSDYFSLQH